LTPRRRAFARCGALCVLLACGTARAQDASAADDSPSVTPYRPTVSDPATLSAPGWVELESGVAFVRDADATRTASVPYLIKYAFDADRGILIGGDAWIDANPRGARGTHGVGDTFVEWKQRFAVDEHSAFGIEAGAVAPTAPDALGNGKPAYVATGIYSVDFGATHLDLNAGGTHFTRNAPHASAWQSAWAAAVSRPFNDTFGATAELSGSAQRGAGHAHQLLGAITYNPARRCALDAGLAYGLDRGGHSREIFLGATVLVGRLR